MAFKVGLLGLGTVGTGTAEILLDPKQRYPLLKDIEITRVGVRSIDKPRAVDLPAKLTTDLTAIVTDPGIDLIVEVIGGIEPARSLILKAIAHGKHVVTANKAVIARHGEEIFTAATDAGVYVLIEAAVAGGIPIIQTLQQGLGVNRIHTLTGIVNGTTNYILTRMQREGGDFAPILTDAQQLGYAEADPTADVDGLDAADKIAILASLAFGSRIKRDEVFCEGIQQINAADIAYADKLGFVIKLLAISKRIPGIDGQQEQIQVRVHPTLVPLTHPLATVNDVYNAILVEGDPIGQVMLFGPGAGKGPTASAIVSDVLNIVALLKSGCVSSGNASAPNGSTDEPKTLHPLLAFSQHHDSTLMPMDDLITRFYARVIAEDTPGVIGALGTCFGEHEVSIESVVQIGFRDGGAEIVVVTHEVEEGAFRRALDQVQQLGTVQSVPSVLRVL